MSSSPDIKLFEFLPILDDLLSPYPDIEVILSSDWALVFGTEATRRVMPSSSVQARILGATYDGCDFDSRLWPMLTRGEQVLDYVRRNKPSRWLAIDDRADGFEAVRDRLVHCQTEVGLGDSAVVEQFRERLRRFFADSREDDTDDRRADGGEDAERYE